MKTRFILSLISLLFFTGISRAQNGCEQSYRRADSAFLAGDWEFAVELIEPCFKTNPPNGNTLQFGLLLKECFMNLQELTEVEAVILAIKDLPGFNSNEIPPQLSYLRSCAAILSHIRSSRNISNLETLCKACLQDGFSKVEKVEIYSQLMDNYYLGLERPKFDSTYKELLKLNPEFRPDTSLQWHRLDSLYKRSSRISISIQGGINQVYPTLIKDFDLDNTRGDQNYYSSNSFLPLAGISINLPLETTLGRRYSKVYPRFYLGFEAWYTQSDLLANKDPLRTISVDSLAFTSRSFIERHTRLDFPVLLKWRPKLSSGSNNRWFLELHGGASANLLLTAELRELNRMTDDPSGTPSNIEEEEIFDVKAQRNELNFTGILGAGIHFKVLQGTMGGNGFLTLTCRGQVFLLDFVKSGTRYTTPKLNFLHGYAHSNYRWNQLHISFGYTHYFFRPKLLKELPF